MSDQYIEIPGGITTSINTLSGALTLVGTSGVTLTTSGSTLTLSSPASLQTYFSNQRVDNSDNAGLVPYYSAPTAIAWSTGSFITGRIYSIPFPNPKARVVKEIGINVTTAIASGKARLAIYTDSGNLTPTTLVVDAGEVDCSTTGFKSVTGLSVSLAAGQMYWLSATYNSTVSTTIGGTSSGHALLGQSVTGGNGVSRYHTDFTYGAYPGTFPLVTNFTLAGGGLPLIFVKFSS